LQTIWKLLATLSTLLLLSGFLLLPITFDTDARLRSSLTPIIILVVLLTTAGLALMTVCWITCPSVLFRLETILLPGFGSCTLGFINIVWGLAITTGKYDTGNAAFSISLGVTLTCAIIFGVLAILCQRKIEKMARRGSGTESGHHRWRSSAYAPLTDPSSTSFHTPSTLYDGGTYSASVNPVNIIPPTPQSGHQSHPSISNSSTVLNHQPSTASLQPSAASLQPTVAPVPQAPKPARPTSFTITQSPFAVPRSEDELVAQQMARLLVAGRDAEAGTAAKSSSQSTFHIEWPDGVLADEYEVEDTSGEAGGEIQKRRNSSGGSGRQSLAPPPEGEGRRKKSKSVSVDGRGDDRSGGTGALERISQAMGMDSRGRQERRETEEAKERKRSRDSRRMEIEMSGLQPQDAGNNAMGQEQSTT
jgi:hypothetical protein